MKEPGTVHWTAPNTNATNESGFTGLPGGDRNFIAEFQFLEIICNWWVTTADVLDKNLSTFWFIANDNTRFEYNAADHIYGMSVRCIRNP